MHEGLLAIWHDVVPGKEAEVSHWYNTEHHAERLSVEGFLSAHRYRLAGGEGRQFLSLYRTRTPAVLSSAAYRARLESPSPRTREIMPTYRNMSRTVCRLALQQGVPEGGHLATLAGAGAPPDPARVFSQLLQRPGVLRCRWLLPEDPALVARSTAEGALRGGDASVAWAALVDTNEAQEALDVLSALEAALRPAQVAQRAAYRLVYAARGDCGIS
ncbi:MAG: hypothetical protein OEV81_04420 [Betaproteobacteria bacterium]|nr:hypothetical protein [Betaproteobacteria bacterium]MDH5221915.1 hypothetical protein [Betaproteobacteria bacterium]MDH5349881.1 hypothetical protein [Betaproteobacteria bacterium]